MLKSSVIIEYMSGGIETFQDVFNIEKGKMFLRLDMPYKVVSIRYEKISQIWTDIIEYSCEYELDSNRVIKETAVYPSYSGEKGYYL